MLVKYAMLKWEEAEEVLRHGITFGAQELAVMCLLSNIFCRGIAWDRNLTTGVHQRSFLLQ